MLMVVVDFEPTMAIDLEARQDNGRLVFAVRDHGSGIPTSDRDIVFEPFRTTKVRGAGLGLAVSRRIVEGRGGQITIADAPGGGAEVTVSIPTGSS